MLPILRGHRFVGHLGNTGSVLEVSSSKDQSKSDGKDFLLSSHRPADSLSTQQWIRQWSDLAAASFMSAVCIPGGSPLMDFSPIDPEMCQSVSPKLNLWLHKEWIISEVPSTSSDLGFPHSRFLLIRFIQHLWTTSWLINFPPETRYKYFNTFMQGQPFCRQA